MTSNGEELKWKQLKDGRTDLIQFENESISSKGIQSEHQSHKTLLKTAAKLADKEERRMKKRMKMQERDILKEAYRRTNEQQVRSR